MSEFQITILLLFLMSFSATILLYIFRIEYKRIKHISYIKQIISSKYDETNELLSETAITVESVSYISKLKNLMQRAGMRFSVYIFVVVPPFL